MFSASHVEALFKQTSRALQRSCTLFDEQCASSNSSSSNSSNVHAITGTATTTTPSSSTTLAPPPATTTATLAFAGVVRVLHDLARMRAYVRACDAVAQRLSREVACASMATVQRRRRGDAYPLLRRSVGFVCSVHRDLCGSARASDHDGTAIGDGGIDDARHTRRCGGDGDDGDDNDGGGGRDVVARLWYDAHTASRARGNAHHNGRVDASATTACSGSSGSPASAAMSSRDRACASSPMPPAHAAQRSLPTSSSTYASTTFDGAAGLAALLVLRALYADVAHNVPLTLQHATCHYEHVTRAMSHRHRRQQTQACPCHGGSNDGNNSSNSRNNNSACKQATCDGTGPCTHADVAALCQLLTSVLRILPAALVHALLTRVAEVVRGAAPTSALPSMSLLLRVLLLRGVVRCLLQQALHASSPELQPLSSSSPSSSSLSPAASSSSLSAAQHASRWALMNIFATHILQPLQQSMRTLYTLYLRNDTDFVTCSRHCVYAVVACTEELLRGSSVIAHSDTTPTMGQATTTGQHGRSTTTTTTTTAAAAAATTATALPLLQQLHDVFLQPLEAHFTAEAARPGMADALYTQLVRRYMRAMHVYTAAHNTDDDDSGNDTYVHIGGTTWPPSPRDDTSATPPSPTTSARASWYGAVSCTAVYRALLVTEAVAQAEMDMASGTKSATHQQRRYKSLLAQSHGKMTMTLLRAVAEDRQLLLDTTALRAPTGHKVHRLHDGYSGSDGVLLYIDDGIVYFKTHAMHAYKPARSIHALLEQLPDHDE